MFNLTLTSAEAAITDRKCISMTNQTPIEKKVFPSLHRMDVMCFSPEKLSFSGTFVQLSFVSDLIGNGFFFYDITKNEKKNYL